MVVLLGDARCAGRLRWDLLEGAPTFDDLPFDRSTLNQLRLWLDVVYRLSVGAAALRDAVDLVARGAAFHPVRDWLSELVWDGRPRLDRLLLDRFGADDKPLVAELGRRWMIGAVARAFEPGCKLDTMLVLFGPQGIGKSSGLAALVPDPRWWSDTKLDLRSREAFVQLRGVWLAELGELGSLEGVSIETVKAFLSSCNDRYRAHYAAESTRNDRQVVFVGTTNRVEFLADASGSRRFWPVHVRRVDVVGIRASRDQLWAEAVAAFRAREPWWLDPAREAELARASERHQVGDPWEDMVSDWLADRVDDFTVEEVLLDVIGVSRATADVAKRTRVGLILSRLGCEKHRAPRDGGGKRPWMWRPPARDEQRGLTLCS